MRMYVFLMPNTNLKQRKRGTGEPQMSSLLFTANGAATNCIAIGGVALIVSLIIILYIQAPCEVDFENKIAAEIDYIELE